MDIQAIQDNIEILESSDTTPNNVAELASLYICYEYLKNVNLPQNNEFNSEAKEVLPAYQKYRSDKMNFQLGKGSEEAVFNSLQLLCLEINDLYQSLYSSSANRKERRILKDSIEKLSSKIQ